MKAILHMSDWNYQDRAYNTTLEDLQTLKQKIQSESMRDAWNWFIDHSDSTSTAGIELADFYLDYTNPIESINEWVFD